MSDLFGVFREDCLRALFFNARVPQRPNTSRMTRVCLRFLQARLIGAAFSLGTFFVAVDKESTSPMAKPQLSDYDKQFSKQKKILN